MTKVWTLRGRRPLVPAAGQNRRLCVYGALNYRNGQTHYMVYPKKSARQFLRFLRQLLAANRKRFLVLVLDNASYRRTGAVLDLLTEHEEQVFNGVAAALAPAAFVGVSLSGPLAWDGVLSFWLPIYSPELSAIEGLWGHLKKTALNNYFFGDTVRLEDAINRAFYELNRHPETALSLAYHTIQNLGETA